MFTVGRWASFGALALLAAAMLVYPGGTLRDPSTRGYLIFQNFLSDLSNTVTFGGQSNSRSLHLAVAGAWLLALAFAGCTLGFVRLYSSSPARRRLAQAAGAAAVVGCAAVVAVSLSPGNRSLAFHVGFSRVAYFACEAAALLFAAATLRDERFSRGVPAGWLAIALVQTSLLAVARWSPEISTNSGLTIRVTAQKVVALVVLGLCIYQCREADRVTR
jgi:hypothetical protein